MEDGRTEKGRKPEARGQKLEYSGSIPYGSAVRPYNGGSATSDKRHQHPGIMH
jgi:hypothetical protein